MCHGSNGGMVAQHNTTTGRATRTPPLGCIPSGQLATGWSHVTLGIWGGKHGRLSAEWSFSLAEKVEVKIGTEQLEISGYGCGEKPTFS